MRKGGLAISAPKIRLRKRFKPSLIADINKMTDESQVRIGRKIEIIISSMLNEEEFNFVPNELFREYENLVGKKEKAMYIRFCLSNETYNLIKLIAISNSMTERSVIVSLLLDYIESQ